MIRSTFIAVALALAGCGSNAPQPERAPGSFERNAEQIDQTQASAERKLADARADFETDRENYRHTAESNLVKLDEDIAKLDAKSKTATGDDKITLNASLQKIRHDREVYAKDVQLLDTATADDWTATKARLDSEWEALRAMVSGA